MKRKERYIARLEEVMITREGDYAFIEYKEEGVPSTRLEIGPEIAGMSDEEKESSLSRARTTAQISVKFFARLCPNSTCTP